MSAPARLARIALVLCLAASTQGLLFVQGAFEVNRDWIAATLCVNQDRPELDCEGACELTKRLQAEQEREDDRQAAELGAALSVAACQAEALAVPADPARTVPPATGEAAALASQHAEGGVFRPPRAV